MSLDHWMLDAARVALLFAAALVAMALLRRSSASTRRMLLVLVLGAAVMVPVLSAFAPAWRVESPAAIASLRGIVVDEPLIAPSVTAVTSSPAHTSLAIVSAPRAHPWNRAALVAIAWIAGALSVLTRLGVGLARTRAIVRRSTEAPSWDRAAKRAGARVPVRMTGELDAPAVSGVIRPVILVPRASASWSDDRRYAVLLHELAHVRQGDGFAQLLAQIVCAVHWFDPLAWIVALRLRVERELAADDAVVLAGARASTYAADLMSIAAGLARPIPSGTLGMAEPSQLAARIVAIVAPDRARTPPGSRATLLLAAACSITSLAIACATPTASTTAKLTSASPSIAAPIAPSSQSTIDPRLQAIADDELDRAMREWTPAAGVVLILDPSTGEILADAGRAHGAPADVAVASAYLPGSTFKAITLAAALEEGVVSPADRFDCEGGEWSYGGKTIRDYAAHGVLTVPEMLAVSSNVGFAKIFDRLGGARLDRWMRAFHFGVAPAVEGAVAGSLASSIEDGSYDGAMIGIGEKTSASPLQVAAAYAAIANGGVYVAPTRARRAGDVPRERVLRADTAHALASLLEAPIYGERSTGSRAQVEGARVAGKTGTAAWDRADGTEGIYASFVGFVPASAPRFVILAGFEQPSGADRSGGSVAAPVFAKVAARALANR